MDNVIDINSFAFILNSAYNSCKRFGGDLIVEMADGYSYNLSPKAIRNLKFHKDKFEFDCTEDGFIRHICYTYAEIEQFGWMRGYND